MPKQVLKIDQFQGGMNSDADPRDIGQDQMVKLENVMVNKYGRIIMMGGGVLHPELNTETTYGNIGAVARFPSHGGHNLFYFSHDHEGAQAPNVSGQDAQGDDYVCIATGATTGHVSIYSRRADDWAIAVNAQFTDAGPTGQPYGGQWGPVFTVVDGNLRVGDGNHETTNVPLWYGYIDRTDFHPTSNYGKVYSHWQTTSASLSTAGDTNYGQLRVKASGFSGDDAYGAYDSDNVDWLSYTYPIGLEVKYNKTNDGGWSDHVLYYYTLLYGDQESKMQRFDAIDNAAAEDSHYKQIRLTVLPTYFKDRNGRCTGCKIYWKKATSTTETSGSAYLLMEASWDQTQSVKKGEDSSNFQAWSAMTDTSTQTGYTTHRRQLRNSGFEFQNPPRLTTFHNQTGYRDGEEEGNFIHAKYRTAVVANRRMYIGNVQSLKWDDLGNARKVHGDRILKSLPNDFDTFPVSRHLDVTVQDGDEIVKLETFADRLLQFKKNKMHIVNVSEDVEFVEATYDFKGIGHPAGACTTDFGIVWANHLGVYFYDGQRVHNLLEKEGHKLISDAEWQDFAINTENAGGTSEVDDCNVAVGFLPKERAVLILNNTEFGDGTRDVYYYDMVGQSWVFGSSKFATLTNTSVRRYSNFINDWNGDLVICRDPGSPYSSNACYFYKWDPTPQEGTIEIITKDIDFGEPGVRKKVYRAHITYKGSSFPTITYAVNGNTGSYTIATPVTAFAGASEWSRAEYKFSSDANSCYSFQLRLHGHASEDFEINDISLVFRLKNVR